MVFGGEVNALDSASQTRYERDLPAIERENGW